MAGTNIDDATLHAAANHCRSAVEAVNGEVSKVRNAKDNVRARWHGVAATTFTNVMEAWEQECKKITEALHDISDLLDKTATTHRTNEEEQQSSFGNFQSMLG